MRHLKTYNEKLIPWTQIPQKGVPYRKLKVESNKEGFYQCEFRCEIGSGRAMICTNKYFRRICNGKIEMKDNEAYIGGISTKPMGKGVGKQFMLELFDYFNVDKFYLSSDSKHPVWTKMATVVDSISEDGLKMTTYSLTRDQLKMDHLKTYEFFNFFKRKPKHVEPKIDVIGTVHDIMLDFVDEGKVELVKQSKDWIHYSLMYKTDMRKETYDTEKRIKSILNEWGIKHYYFQHSHLYIISDEFYNGIYKIFKGLRKEKVCNNSYQYLMIKNFAFYMYINGDDINISSNIIKYLQYEYNIISSSLYNILEEVIPPMYKLGPYMRCRTIDHHSFKSIRFKYYQPSLIYTSHSGPPELK